jgi:hypothetical protein
MPNVWLLLVLALGVSTGCKTTIVSADPNSGIELVGERRLRLALDRVKLKVGNAAVGADGAICYTCGEGATTSVSSVLLPFIATNESREGWVIESSMFTLRRRDVGEADLYARIAAESRVLIEVAPRSSARFSVPIVLKAFGTEPPPTKDFFGEYVLSVGEPGAVILERKLSIGAFHQGYQALRMVGLFLVGLALSGL